MRNRDVGAMVPLHLRVRAVPATATIVVVCVAAFAWTLWRCLGASTGTGLLREALVSLSSYRGVLLELGALDLVTVWRDGSWWRLFTAMFLHGSLVHLGLNMWSLWSVGEWCEAAWGPLKTACIFLGAGLSGGAASLAWAEGPMVVGASGGVLGLAGALLVARVVGDERVRERISPVSARALLSSLVMLLALGWFVPVIAQAGHVGGLVTGLLLGLLWCRDWSSGARVGIGCVVVGQWITVALLARDPVRPQAARVLMAQDALDRGELVAAAELFEAALREDSEDPVLQNALAYTLAERGVELERAQWLVEAALSQEPESADMLDTLGWILCRQGRVDEADRTLRRARLLAPAPIPEIELHLVECATARAQVDGER